MTKHERTNEKWNRYECFLLCNSAWCKIIQMNIWFFMVFVLIFLLHLHDRDEQFKQLPRDILQFAVSTSDSTVIWLRRAKQDPYNIQFGDSSTDCNACGRYPTPAKRYFWNFVFCMSQDLVEDDCCYWSPFRTSKLKVNVIVPSCIQLNPWFVQKTTTLKTIRT